MNGVGSWHVIGVHDVAAFAFRCQTPWQSFARDLPSIPVGGEHCGSALFGGHPGMEKAVCRRCNWPSPTPPGQVWGAVPGAWGGQAWALLGPALAVASRSGEASQARERASERPGVQADVQHGSPLGQNLHSWVVSIG